METTNTRQHTVPFFLFYFASLVLVSWATYSFVAVPDGIATKTIKKENVQLKTEYETATSSLDSVNVGLMMQTELLSKMKEADSLKSVLSGKIEEGQITDESLSGLKYDMTVISRDIKALKVDTKEKEVAKNSLVIIKQQAKLYHDLLDYLIGKIELIASQNTDQAELQKQLEEAKANVIKLEGEKRTLELENIALQAAARANGG